MRSIAIIGGGPAGARAAWRLAAAGFAATLFEPRARFEKACGGGIPARSLATYPFLADPRLPVRRVETCVVIAPSARRASFALAEPLLMVRRADLHQFMLDRAVEAGADLVPERVLDFRRNGAGWSLTSAAGGADRHRGPFDFLVAADGAAGFARRRLAGALAPAGLAQGLGYYLPEAAGDDMVTLRFYSGLDGYLWVFPRLDHASVGICAGLGRRPAAGLRAILDAFVRERYGNAALARAVPYAAVIPGAPARADAPGLAGDGWALVGDCARTVDPLTREGIHYAMLSADLMADALERGRPDGYPAAWSARMGAEFSWAAEHTAGFFDPVFIERLVHLAARSPRLASVLADLIAGRQPYRTLRRRLLLVAPVVAWQAAWRRTPAPDVTPARGS